MKKLMFFTAFCLVTLIAHAQPVAVVNFMKVPQGGYDAFVSNEKEWKKLHQNRVNEGKMIAWELFYVHNSGTGSPYNCATVDVYPSMEAALTEITIDEIKKAMGEKYNDVLKKTNTVRNLVYSEMLSQVLFIPSKATDKYLMISSMKTDDTGKYYDMEKKAFMPLHQAAVDQGKLNGWSIWARMFPEDTTCEAYAVNAYSSSAQLNAMDYMAALEKAREGKNTGELMEMFKLIEETGTIRTIVKTQLWELIDVTNPKK